MRVLKVICALLLAGTGMTGCGLFGHNSGPSQDEQIEKIINEDPQFDVLLTPDSTTTQRKDMETALRALPGFARLTYSDHNAAYQQMKQMFSADPSGMPNIKPESLPESYEVHMTALAAVQQVRNNQGTLIALHGVQKLIFPCMTVSECRQKFPPRPTTPPT